MDHRPRPIHPPPRHLLQKHPPITPNHPPPLTQPRPPNTAGEPAPCPSPPLLFLHLPIPINPSHLPLGVLASSRLGVPVTPPAIHHRGPSLTPQIAPPFRVSRFAFPPYPFTAP